MGRLISWIMGSSIKGEDGRSWDDRSRALCQAGYRLIGTHDFEAVSVAQVAEAAGCSVGAFYQRFENKDRFVGFLVRTHFEIIGERVSDALDVERFQECSARDVAEAVVDAMLEIAQGHGAGIARAAMKRCHSDRANLELVERYRALVVERAEALLVPMIGQQAGDRQVFAVREVIQIGQAVVFDALIHRRGALNLDNSITMRDALTSMLVGMLQIEAEDCAIEVKDAREVFEAPKPAPSTRIKGLRGDLRGRDKADHAICSGEISRTAVGADVAQDA